MYCHVSMALSVDRCMTLTDLCVGPVLLDSTSFTWSVEWVWKGR